MAHNTTTEYLDEKNIDRYFSVLADKIIEAGIGEHHVLVVGGAAMALKYRDGRSTVDIDICVREQKNLYACCQQVADENNLPEDWINADVMHSESFSYRLFDHATLYRIYKNVLHVYVASALDLYCMKIVSFRPKDVQDTEVIAAELREDGIGLKEVEENFVRLYGDTYLLKNDARKARFVVAQIGN